MITASFYWKFYIKCGFINSNIRIFVGDPDATTPPKEYQVNAFQLTNRSHFFRKALTGDWKEATEKTVKLPEDDPNVFECYLSLVIAGRIPVGKYINKGKVHSRAKIRQEVYATYSRLIELFVLCDKLQDRQGINTVIDTIIEQSLVSYTVSDQNDPDHPSSGSIPGSEDHLEPQNHQQPLVNASCTPGSAAVNLIYNNTAGPRGIRRLVVDLWAHRPVAAAGLLSSDHEKKLNPEFLHDLALRLAQCMSGIKKEVRAEDYHEEDKDSNE